MTRLSQILLLWVLALAPMRAAAETPPVVVELFTSQGCSSCPPADALLAQLAPRDDLIALSWHIDYWDYLGWKDDLAQPSHTDRQHAYNGAAGKHMVYTPQMVVGGRHLMVGSRADQVLSAVMTEAERAPQIDISHASGSITLRARSPLTETQLVTVLRVAPEMTVSIRGGENAGREITYVNVVRDALSAALWSGERPLHLTVAEASEDLVILAQDAPHEGHYLGAVRGALRIRP